MPRLFCLLIKWHQQTESEFEKRTQYPMLLTIDLPSEAEQALHNKARAAGVSAEQYAQRVLQRDLGVAEHGKTAVDRPLQSAADMILQRIRKLPREAFEGLPSDGASQHDHYLYGSPKRKE
jgi:hypothetical protein